MLDLLVGALLLISAGFIAAGYYVPPQWLVALVWLGLGLRTFGRGLSKQLAERDDRQFGKTIEEYRNYKRDLKGREQGE